MGMDRMGTWHGFGFMVEAGVGEMDFGYGILPRGQLDVAFVGICYTWGLGTWKSYMGGFARDMEHVCIRRAGVCRRLALIRV